MTIGTTRTPIFFLALGLPVRDACRSLIDYALANGKELQVVVDRTVAVYWTRSSHIIIQGLNDCEYAFLHIRDAGTGKNEAWVYIIPRMPPSQTVATFALLKDVEQYGDTDFIERWHANYNETGQ